MKILYITQYFTSGNDAGGIRPYKHTQYLSDMGFEIEVLTGKRSYMEAKDIKLDLSNEKFDVISINNSFYNGKSFFLRLNNYFSFFVKALFHIMTSKREYDVVFSSSPSLLVGLLGYISAKKKSARFVLEIRDLWPESAITLGFIKNKFLIFLAKKLESFLYKKAEKIICLTEGIKSYIDNITIQNKTIVVTNGYDDIPNEKEQALEDMSLYNEKFICMYAGSHGYNNGLDKIIKAAKILKDNKEIIFYLIGNGGYKKELISLKEKYNLENIIFKDSVPKNQISSYLSMASVLLWPVVDTPINPEFKKGVLPNKVFDYLASDIPIITTYRYSEGARIIQKLNCGSLTKENTSEELANEIKNFYYNSDLLKNTSGKSKAFVKENYHRKNLVKKIANVFLQKELENLKW